MQPLFKLSPGPLLKSGLGPLARCCTHKGSISRPREHVYLSPDQDWDDLQRCHYLSQTRVNTRGQNVATIQVSHGQLLKSGLGHLARYGTHQETMSGRPEEKYLPSDQRLEWPAEGPLL